MSDTVLDPLIEGYLRYCLTVARRAPRTITDMRCSLTRAVIDLASTRPDCPLWKLNLEDYVQWLEQLRGSGYSGNSLGKFLSHVRGFLDYAWRSGRAQRNVLDGFYLNDTTPKAEPVSLTLAQAQRLIAACSRGNANDRRDRMMVLLLYGCGLRTAELCALNVEHVDRERCEVQVLKGKGDRQRTVPIPEAVLTELLAYLFERRATRGPLFRTLAKHQRIRSVDVCKLMRQVTAKAGLVSSVTARTLRHSFATHLMDRGVDLAVISSLMGHRSPHETGVYLHVLPGRPQAAVNALRRRRMS